MTSTTSRLSSSAARRRPPFSTAAADYSRPPGEQPSTSATPPSHSQASHFRTVSTQTATAVLCPLLIAAFLCRIAASSTAARPTAALLQRLAVAATCSSTFETAASRAMQRLEATSDVHQVRGQESRVRRGAGPSPLLRYETSASAAASWSKTRSLRSYLRGLHSTKRPRTLLQAAAAYRSCSAETPVHPPCASVTTRLRIARWTYPARITFLLETVLFTAAQSSCVGSCCQCVVAFT